ncbi:hypothetical protein AAVH_08721 [Aphelenchoides avenae]|nr:hypothetical protein AAVH_08721 [Aphelenchus avenae]
MINFAFAHALGAACMQNLQARSSIYDSVPEEDDGRLQARMEADREQDAAIAAAARAAAVPVGRRVRIQQPGVLALQELDSRIRTATDIGPDDAICPYCLSGARMPRYLPCGNCGHPADNPRGNVACLACLQKQFDRHINGGLKCPLCREQLQRPADGDAFTGTEDALEHLTGVPLSRLVDLEKARLLAQQPACDGVVSLKKLRKRFRRSMAQAVVASGAEEATEANLDVMAFCFRNWRWCFGWTGDGGTSRGPSGVRRFCWRSTPAPSEVSGRGARSAVSDAQRWMRFSFALAAQLEQRAEALRVLEEQLSWVAEREPTTSAGPSMAQIAARLDEMPDDLRFPPALLDALLTEAVGGAFVDLSHNGGSASGVDEATALRESKAVTTSELGEEGSADVSRSVWEDDGTPEPEEQEAEASDGEAMAPERTVSEAEAALGPVPDEWLGGNRAKLRIGFRCSCEDCQRGTGRFRGKDFRSYTWHYGRYPFQFRFHCPVEGCMSARTNRDGLLDHVKANHGLQTKGEDAKWWKRRMGRFQSTACGPTRLDPFFRRGHGNVPVDEPLPPKKWRAYLASLRRPGASDEGVVGGGSEVEVSGGGGVGVQSRASSAERTERPGGESTETEGTAVDGGPASVAAGVAVLVAAAGGSGSDERRSKKKKASKRNRDATEGGDGAAASKKRKPDGGDSDFNPESDEEQ